MSEEDFDDVDAFTEPEEEIRPDALED